MLLPTTGVSLPQVCMADSRGFSCCLSPFAFQPWLVISGENGSVLLLSSLGTAESRLMTFLLSI